MQRTVALFVTLVSLPAAAQAQAPATSFAELASLLKAGETVSVTKSAGKTVKGKVQQVSDTILVLRSGQHDASAPRSVHRSPALAGPSAQTLSGQTTASTPPAPLDQALATLTVGDSVDLVDREGREHTGVLLSASAAAVRLMLDGQPRDYQAENIQALYKRATRVERGAWIGLGAGAAFGVGMAAVWSAAPGPYARGSALFGGIGAAVGAAIGAAISRKVEIYRRPSQSGPDLVPSAAPAAQQPNLARPRPDPKWAASFVVGTTSSGPANDLEDAMRAAQFDENRGICLFGLCFPGTEHPFSNTGFGAVGFPWAVSSRRWLSPWYGIGVSGGVAEVGETIGQRRDTTEYLDVRYRVAALAPLFIVRPVRGVHMASFWLNTDSWDA